MKLVDITRFATAEEVEEAVLRTRESIGHCEAWLISSAPRSERLKGTLMILARLRLMLTCYGSGTVETAPIEVLALSARNAFELNARLSLIFSSEASFREWLGEAATDERQIIEACLEAAGCESDVDPSLNARLRELEMTQQRLGASKAPRRTNDVASKADLGSEYKAMFGIMSKCVHPSSFLVNASHTGSCAAFLRSILTICLQLYAQQAIACLQDFFQIPDEIIDAW